MIFLFLGVTATVKLACEALDAVHTQTKSKRLLRLARTAEQLGEPLLPAYRPPPRVYSTREEGRRGENEGSIPDMKRAEARFNQFAVDYPKCSRCDEPVMHPEKYFAEAT